MYKKYLESSNIYNIWSVFHFIPRLNAIKKITDAKKHPKILDLGCGTGLLRKYYRDCDYTGIDSNPKYINYAQNTYSGKFICGDITKIGEYVNDEKYDFIVLNGVLHHINNLGSKSIIESARDYLETGGSIIIVDPVMDRDLNAINRLLVKYDRGDHIRDLHGYMSVFGDVYDVCYNYSNIKLLGVVFWKIITIELKKRR